MYKIISVVALVLVLVSCGSNIPSNQNESKPQSIFETNDFIPVVAGGSNIPANLAALIPAIGKSSNDCTMFHIGDGLVATAGHCINDSAASSEGAQDRKPCQTLSIEWGKTGESEVTGVSRCIEILDRRFDGDQDFAFLKVDPFPAEKLELSDLGPLTWSSESENSREVTVLGYPNRRNLEWSQTCQAKPASDNSQSRFEHWCDTERGNSGSPVIDIETGKVIGIHNGGNERNNYAIYSSGLPVNKSRKKIENGSADSGWDGEELVSFGPFQNNQHALLIALGQEEGTRVSFVIDFEIEEPYDQLTVFDKNGRKYSYSGTGVKNFSNIATPVTVAFKSDYAGISKKVEVKQISFGYEL